MGHHHRYGTWAADEHNLKVGDEQLRVAALLVTLSPNGLLGFRRGQDRILCNAAARLFKGGGHPYAAGGEYGMYHDFQAACDDIFTTLSTSEEWISEEEASSSSPRYSYHPESLHFGRINHASIKEKSGMADQHRGVFTVSLNGKYGYYSRH
jgi:hypothetical protein